MTDQPQPLDLDTIEARANNATDGPWFNDSHEIYAGPHTDIPAMNEWIGETCDPNRPDHGAANAALAAWSRDGVPALVAELRRMHERAAHRRRAMLAAQESERVLQRQIDEQAATIDARDAEVRRLTAELDAVRSWVVNTIHGTAAAEVGSIVGQQPPPIEYCGHCKRTHLDCQC